MMWVSILLLASLTITATYQQELIPAAPSQLTAVTVSCDSIEVSWNAVLFNGTQLDTYQVFYTPSDSQESMMMMVNELEVTLSNLHPFTTYTISIAAVSSDNITGATSEVQDTTFGAVPATNLRAHNVTNHSAIFSWDINGENIGCNGSPIDHDSRFRVRYRPVDDSEQEKINVRETSVELLDLLPYTNYTAHVTTADTSGDNVKSSNFIFTTLPGVPSAPILVDTITNDSVPTQLLITWQEPLTLNGVISHYNVEVTEQGSSQLQVFQTNNTELLLTGLKPSATYIVRVQATNHATLDQNEPGVIPGPFANDTAIRLPDPLPVPPGHPRDFKVTHTVLYGTNIELQFRWKQPTTGDPVDTYWISCNRSAAKNNDTLTIKITLPTLHLMIKLNADPFTSYQCHSYASNEVGNGPFSRTVNVPPIPLASSQVRQLQATTVNHSHVWLSWNKPHNRSEYITTYLVILRDPSAKTATNFTVPSPDTSLMVGALTGNTMYSFDVIAVTVFNGEQLYSNVTSTQVTTQTGPPSYPRNVVVEAINNATVQVHWSTPIPTNGLIVHYIVDAEVKSVYYTENGEREFSDSFNAVVQDRYYNSSLLTPGSNYVFNITAYTSDGPGPTVSESVTLDNGRKDAITYFQLKLRPFTDCTKSQDASTKQDIKDQLIHGLEEKCACVLDPDITITDIQTQCNVEDSHLIYIGRIIGTKDLRPLVLLDLLEDWKNEKNALVLQATGESLMMDQSCPLYLSSPRDRNCVNLVTPSPTADPQPPSTSSQPPSTSSQPPSTSSQPPSTSSQPPSTSSSSPSGRPQPTSNVEDVEEEKDDGLNIPILVACFVGGVFLGCFITLCILITVFCHRLKKRNKEIDEEAIYARPSRKNKRIKVTTANGNGNPMQMQSCPAYTVDNGNGGKDSNYAVPRKRSGSIDSVDLHLHRYNSEAKDVVKPLPSNPRPPYTPPLPPAYAPNGFYTGSTKQAKSMDNLSSYTHGQVTAEQNESLYQAPRYPSLSVDDLINGIPSQRFHRTFSPLHAATRSPGAIPRTPKDTYDDPRTPKRVIAISNNTYDAPRSNTQPGNKPLPVNDIGSSPKSVPRTPMDAYDDPRKLSAIVSVGNAMYDTPRHMYDHQQPGTPPKQDDVFNSPTRTRKDAYDDPRKPLVVSVGDSTYDSPRKPYNYTQIDTPQKPTLVDDKDDPDYSYVE